MAREFQKFGHTVRLMAPKFVVPYRLSGKRGKNDAADAAAICEAVARPNMRFVPVKSLEQQSQLMVHRARQGFVEQRTSTFNRIRGLLTLAHIKAYFCPWPCCKSSRYRLVSLWFAPRQNQKSILFIY